MADLKHTPCDCAEWRRLNEACADLLRERDALRELLDTTQTAAELLAAQRDVLQDAVKAAWFCLDNIAMYYSPSEEDERQFQHWYDTAWAAFCYMCPNKPHHEWEWQRVHAPADHKKAIAFEAEMQEHDPDLWLTDTGTPLAEADFSQPDDFFTGRCDSGMCFV